jgi:hypothetical protein
VRYLSWRSTFLNRMLENFILRAFRRISVRLLAQRVRDDVLVVTQTSSIEDTKG